MKAIISSTYDDKYLYFLPIVTWLWNKLGVDVICFLPYRLDKTTYPVKTGIEGDDLRYTINDPRFGLIVNTCYAQNLKLQKHFFTCPEHKEATYAQCSRLYAACLDLPEDEVLITSDIDMGIFKIPDYAGFFSIFGTDLVPPNQYPMCYVSAEVKQWRLAIGVGKTYQEQLDLLLGEIDCDNMKANYWAKDQETLFNLLKNSGAKIEMNRAKTGTQFATNRIDRDDSFWRERLSPDIIDCHFWRPGYTDENFSKTLELLQYFYPNEDFTWIVEYTQAYKKLVNE